MCKEERCSLLVLSFGVFANSVDPGQKPPFCGLWSGSAVFAYVIFMGARNASMGSKGDNIIGIVHFYGKE